MRIFLCSILLALSCSAVAELNPSEAVGKTSSQGKHDRPGPADSKAGAQENLPKPPTNAPHVKQPAGEQTKAETKEKKEDPKAEREKRWGVTEWSAISSAAGTLISALVTIALAALGYFSWRTSSAAVDIAKDSLESSKQLAIKQSRAYVFVTKIDLKYSSLYDEATNDVFVILKNYGQTPAQMTNFCITVIEGSDRRETLADDQAMRAILGPGESSMPLVKFRITDAEQVVSGHNPLRLLVSIEYRDMDGVLHHVKEPFIFTSSGLNYGFVPYEDDEHRSRD